MVREQKLSFYELSTLFNHQRPFTRQKEHIEHYRQKLIFNIQGFKTTSEFLLKPVFYEEIGFDLFRSNVCHFAKYNGKDYSDILVQENDIRAYDYMGYKAQSLYLLGMLDHLCHKYNVPLIEEYTGLRQTSLEYYL